MSTPVSPKVYAALIVGLLVSAIAPNVGLVTPEMLSALGAWAPFWYGVGVTLIASLAAYMKRDPLRSKVPAGAVLVQRPAPGTGKHVAEVPE